MKMITGFFWMISGAALAFLYLQSLVLSVKLINPENPKGSKWLIVGGSVIRWIIVFLSLALALSQSLIAMILTFCSFLTTRMIILFKWNANFGVAQSNIHQTKE